LGKHVVWRAWLWHRNLHQAELGAIAALGDELRVDREPAMPGRGGGQVGDRSAQSRALITALRLTQ
jgi:hypothetical protein